MTLLPISEFKGHPIAHMEEKPHQCYRCGQGCFYNNSLIIHMRKQSEEKTFLCSHCGKAIPHIDELNSHLGTHFGGETIPMQPICKRFLKEYSSYQPFEESHWRKKRTNATNVTRLSIKMINLQDILKPIMVRHHTSAPNVTRISKAIVVL
ncbi:unnamed protein product [Meganyctiphanes norvegica]|uniref:C2H2-type domain-containing protein n=1 Tax=Meganyctiphanes norvegica TaxID=48144 RepID=A0AAV2SJA3_MEGNR